MTFHFNAYSTPLLFGFVQGWVYAVLLWVRGRREERLSDVLLGWVLVGCCFNIWEYMLGFGGIEILWRELEFFPRGLGLLLAPLCYFYLKSQINADFRFGRRDLIYAVPFLIDTTYHLVVFSMGHDFVERWKLTVHYPYHIADITYVIDQGQSLYYLWLSRRLYRDYRAWIKTQFSETETISFRWFRNFLIALTISLIFSFLVTILDLWLNLDYWNDWWGNLVGVVLIYYVSIQGYAQIQPAKRLVFTRPEPDVTNAELPAETAVEIPILAENQIILPDKSLAGKILPADLTAHLDQLLALMDAEKPYLEPELSLADLARRLRTNPVVLSQVINAGVGKNFNDFVNEYRVTEFKQQVIDPARAHLSLLGVALDCGFNSKATFNRAFRKFTGLSPKEYADTQKAPTAMLSGLH
ncbi:MAG: AraC family transcriptional regulator [Bacteroidetes bacterium]|nr:AraC family transcriptional regulator [Fibrella sp.]